jgi:N-methylhydantoinase B/oxoprolinase/acetone carboxylase alpha subunit
VQRVTKGVGTDGEEVLHAKVTGVTFNANQAVRIEVPNGAGYGDPLERDPDAVREDVLDDFTTLELARDAYGVVFNDESTLEIDLEATARRRDELRAGA